MSDNNGRVCVTLILMLDGRYHCWADTTQGTNEEFAKVAVAALKLKSDDIATIETYGLQVELGCSGQATDTPVLFETLKRLDGMGPSRLWQAFLIELILHGARLRDRMG